MKRWIVMMFLACWCGLALRAQTADRPQARFLINGMFFSEAPTELDGNPVSISILRMDDGRKLMYVKGLELSAESKAYALSPHDVPDADTWLAKAKEATFFLDMSIQPPKALRLKEGDALGAFTATDMTGKVWTERDFIGRPLVLNFWYTGCGPCIKEMPELSSWMDICPDARYLAVTWNSAAQIKPIVERRHFRFTQIVNDSLLFRKFGIEQTPTTVIVNGEGRIHKIVVGTNQQKREALLSALKELTDKQK